MNVFPYPCGEEYPGVVTLDTLARETSVSRI
jgi:hypothetical protein